MKNRKSDLDMKKYGVVILAAGDASRLEMDIPKGCVEIHKSSLLQRILEKCPENVAIMTSNKNHERMVEHVLGLKFEKKIDFFIQKSAPVEGLFLESPMGNGDLFRAFYSSPSYQNFLADNVERVVVCPVDNPLCQPYSPLLHAKEELVVLGVKKRSHLESVGTLIEEDKLSVREYTIEKSSNGLAYTGIFSTTLDFFKRAAAVDKMVKIHHIEKIHQGKRVYKNEKFVFDFFPLAKSYKVVEVDRLSHFLPIKRAIGEDSLEEALRVLR